MEKLSQVNDFRELQQVNRLVQDDHNAHREKILKSFKGNPKRFYCYMRNLQTVKAKVIQLKKKDGKITASDKEAADVLCSTF